MHAKQALMPAFMAMAIRGTRACIWYYCVPRQAKWKVGECPTDMGKSHRLACPGCPVSSAMNWELFEIFRSCSMRVPHCYGDGGERKKSRGERQSLHKV